MKNVILILICLLLVGVFPDSVVAVTLPNITFTSVPINYSNQTSATITFTIDESATFYCSLDGAEEVDCTSPVSYSGLAKGEHTFSLKAIDSAGNISSTVKTWNVNTALAAGSAVLLPQTGQAKCYAAAGAELPSCDGSGQDGENRAGVHWPDPRFKVNGDGTVSDTMTGLTWTRDANLMVTRDPDFDQDGFYRTGDVTWQHALDYVKKLNQETYLGYSDWRLPNNNELISLVDASQDKPALPLGQPFSNLQNGWLIHWTSSSFPDAPRQVYTVFSGGFGIHFGFTKGPVYLYNVWPVRTTSGSSTSQLFKTGQTSCFDDLGTEITCSGTGQDGELQQGLDWLQPRFSVNGNATVTDNMTGLIWSKDANLLATRDAAFDSDDIVGDGLVTWQHALDYVAKLNLESCLGFNDWRLPNINELASLVDIHTSPALAAGHPFTNMQLINGIFWSSNTNVRNPAEAWSTGFIHGSLRIVTDKSSCHFSVWPVRGGYYQQKLTVTKSGTGTGAVTADTGNLTWSGSTGTTRIDPGDTIEFTAAAVNGSAFAGWSGACSGKGTCKLVADAAKNVTATFDDIEKPTISAFSLPAITNTLTVSNITFTSADNRAVTGYYLSETETAPAVDAPGWSASAPSRYPFTSPGNKKLYAFTKDAAGNVSDFASANIVCDPLKPTIAITSPTHDVTIYGDGKITIQGTVDGTVTGITSLTITADGKEYHPVVTNCSFSQEVIFSVGNLYPVTVTVTDEAGNSGSVTWNIIFSKGIIAINGYAASTATTAVKLSLGYYPSAAKMQFLANNKSWTAWETFAATKSITLPAGDGLKTVYVRFMDDGGNISPIYSAIILIDSKAPTGSVTINNGAAVTTTPAVTLNLAVTDITDGISMQVSNSSTFVGAVWEPLVASKSFTLTNTYGNRTVYARFKDAGGKISAATSDTIVYQQTAQATGDSGALIINGGAQYTTATGVKLTIIKPVDAVYTQMSLSNNSTSWSAWSTIPTTAKSYSLPSGDGVKTAYLKFRTAALVQSAIYVDSIIFDSKLPVGTISINDGAYVTNSSRVTLSLTAADLNGVTDMQFSTNGKTWSGWEKFAESKVIDLLTGLGARKAYVRYLDSAGKISKSNYDTITVDTMAPIGTLKINDGATSTSNPLITLNVAAKGTPVALQFSMDNGVSWSDWEPYAKTRKVTLPGGTGTRSVQVKLKDLVGNVSGLISDTIMIAP